MSERTGNYFDINEYLDERREVVLKMRKKDGSIRDLWVAYDPNAATPKMMNSFREVKRLMDRKASDDEIRMDQRIVDFLKSFLLDWDVTDRRTGEKVPVTNEGIDNVPIPMLMAVAEGIMADMTPAKDADNPKAIQPNGSSAISSRKRASTRTTGGSSTGRSRVSPATG